MKYFAPLFTLFASAMAQVKDCDESDCILMMIGDNFSPLNTDQCKLHAPRLLDFGGDHFCGAFLDDTTGVVVTNVCVLGGFCDPGAYEVYAAPVVDECTKMIDDINDSGEDIVAPPRGSGSGSGSGWGAVSTGRLDEKFSTILYSCVSACPFLASAPVAQVDEASTASTFADVNTKAITHKFTVQDTKYNGYTSELPNNFGALKGSVDTVAAKVPLALSYKIKDATPDKTCGGMSLKMMPVAPSAMAAVLLFPAVAFKTGGNVGALITGLMTNKFWFEHSVSSGAKMYFYNALPSDKVGSMNGLIQKVGAQKAIDFAGLGDKFKSGDLGFLYGVLSQAKVESDVTNVATLNFPVHGFQESFAYLFFSPMLGEYGSASTSDMYALYGFSLNMLVRKYASVDAMCGASISSDKTTGCSVKSGVYTPVLVDAAGAPKKGVPKPSDLKIMAEVYNSFGPAVNGGYSGVGALKIMAPPAYRLGLIHGVEPDLFLFDRDIDGIPSEALGDFTTATDPTVAVETQCDLMIAEIKASETRRRLATSTGAGSGSGSGYTKVSKVAEERMPHVNDQCLAVLAADNDAIDDAVDAVAAQAEYKEIFDIHACHPLSMISYTCSVYYNEQYKAFTSSGKTDIESWIMHVDEFAESYKATMNTNNQIFLADANAFQIDMPPGMPMGPFLDPKDPRAGRRLSKTDDFGLSTLRSGSASSALAREDGVLTRANFDARRLGGSGSGSGSGCSGPAGCVSGYIMYLGIYQHCIEQLKTETACATILSNLNSADAKVNAFYSKTELIAAASCSKAVPVEPSDCPVSMFDKEVYFMWGEGGTTSNYERPKTSVYVGKGLPAASRLDRLMNFFTEFFASA